MVCLYLFFRTAQSRGTQAASGFAAQALTRYPATVSLFGRVCGIHYVRHQYGPLSTPTSRGTLPVWPHLPRLKTRIPQRTHGKNCWLLLMHWPGEVVLPVIEPLLLGMPRRYLASTRMTRLMQLQSMAQRTAVATSFSLTMIRSQSTSCRDTSLIALNEALESRSGTHCSPQFPA